MASAPCTAGHLQPCPWCAHRYAECGTLWPTAARGEDRALPSWLQGSLLGQPYPHTTLSTPSCDSPPGRPGLAQPRPQASRAPSLGHNTSTEDTCGWQVRGLGRARLCLHRGLYRCTLCRAQLLDTRQKT